MGRATGHTYGTNEQKLTPSEKAPRCQFPGCLIVSQGVPGFATKRELRKFDTATQLLLALLGIVETASFGLRELMMVCWLIVRRRCTASAEAGLHAISRRKQSTQFVNYKRAHHDANPAVP